MPSEQRVPSVMYSRSVTPLHKLKTDPFDHPTNMSVKSPFKQDHLRRHATTPKQNYVSPDRQLLEQTSAAVEYFTQVLDREAPTTPSRHPIGRRTSARLMPLHPVPSDGLTMEHCQGIVAGTRPSSTLRTLHQHSDGLTHRVIETVHKTWKSAQNINAHDYRDKRQLRHHHKKHSEVDLTGYAEFSRSRFGDSSTDSGLEDSGQNSKRVTSRPRSIQWFKAKPKVSDNEPSASIRVSLNCLYESDSPLPKSRHSSARSSSRTSSARYSTSQRTENWLSQEKKLRADASMLAVYGHGSAEGVITKIETPLTQSMKTDIMLDLKKTSNEKKMISLDSKLDSSESNVNLCLSQRQALLRSRRLPKSQRKRAQSARPWLRPIDSSSDEDDERTIKRRYRSRSAGNVSNLSTERLVVVAAQDFKEVKPVIEKKKSDGKKSSAVMYNLTLYQMIHPDVQSSLTGEWEIPTKIARNSVQMKDDGRPVPGMGEYKSQINQELMNVVKAQMTTPANRTADDRNYYSALTSNPLINSFINAKPERGFVYYFAYGSDMNERRFSTLINRSVDFDAPTWVLLYGFKLTPAPYKEEISESHPRLEIRPRSAVQGRLYAITSDESLRLDCNPGFLKKFHRMALPVWLLTRSHVEEPSLSQYCLPAIVYLDANVVHA